MTYEDVMGWVVVIGIMVPIAVFFITMAVACVVITIHEVSKWLKSDD